MKRVTIGAAAGIVAFLVTGAFAQDIEVSSLDVRQGASNFNPGKAAASDPRYIIDVSGKQVRLVGPRFFPDHSRDVTLAGRSEALGREEARSELAAR